MWRLVIGISLFIAGLLFSIPRTRPWMDYDFLLAWCGFILVFDYISLKLSKFSLFSNIPNLLLLAFSSVCMWWFYEGLNNFLRLYSYPSENLYNQTEFGVFLTVGSATIIPFFILTTYIVKSILFKGDFRWTSGTMKKSKVYFFVALGILSFILNFFFPLYAWVLAATIPLFIFDSFNAKKSKRSIITQIQERNFKPLLILGTSSIFGGFIWEFMNFIILKWQYPIVPWFWTLPQPITTKLFEMPLAGYLGYVPFIFGIFAFIEFLGLGKNWLKS